jgi:hypothetical protein
MVMGTGVLPAMSYRKLSGENRKDNLSGMSWIENCRKEEYERRNRSTEIEDV